MDFYYYSVCHVCKKESENLKKCSQCKVVHYCSREHQLKDWVNHKDICKVISTSNSTASFSGGGPVEFGRHKIFTAVLWHFRLERDLSTSEHEMWMFPKVCAVCYDSVVTIVCRNCWSVAYCSVQHQQIHAKHHEGFCSKLKVCLEIHQMMHKAPPKWDQISFEFQKQVKKLPEDICEVMKVMKIKNKPNHWKKAINFILMTEFFSSAVNIVYALEKAKFVEHRIGKKTKLVIHTTTTEICENTSWGALMEFLAHWILNLKVVKLFVFNSDEEEAKCLSFTHECDDCRKRRFNASVIFPKGEYHDFIATIPRPDLVLMFNTPIPDVGTDEWSESMPKLLTFKNVPIVLTSYTQENLNKVVEKFPSPWIKYYLQPQENLYGSLRPLRNSEEGTDPVIYRNSFIAIIAKK